MALGQLVSLPRMAAILATYGLHSHALALAVTVGLIAGELLCGVWFLARPRSRAAVPAIAYAVVSVVWGLLAVQALARGLTVPVCGCFGTYLAQRLSGLTLAEDVLLLVYAVVLWRGVRRARSG